MKASTFTLAVVTALASQSLTAAELELKLTNLTQGLHFTPILITAHNSDEHLFEVAMPATT